MIGNPKPGQLLDLGRRKRGLPQTRAIAGHANRRAVCLAIRSSVKLSVSHCGVNLDLGAKLFSHLTRERVEVTLSSVALATWDVPNAFAVRARN